MVCVACFLRVKWCDFNAFFFLYFFVAIFSIIIFMLIMNLFMRVIIGTVKKVRKKTPFSDNNDILISLIKHNIIFIHEVLYFFFFLSPLVVLCEWRVFCQFRH